MNNDKLSIENIDLKQQITQFKSQKANNFQNSNDIPNNSNDTQIDLLKQKEDEIKDLKQKINDLDEKIKRYPFIIEKNEYLINIIFYSMDQKVHYPMICKNTDIIDKIEGKLYVEYPYLSGRENNFECNGNLINKFESLEKNNIKNGDIIILNQIDSSRLTE